MRDRTPANQPKSAVRPRAAWPGAGAWASAVGVVAVLVGLSATVLPRTVLPSTVLQGTVLASGVGNDDFANAEVVTSASFAGTTVGATVEAGEPNVSRGDASAWYSWTPAEPEMAYVVPMSEGTGTIVHVYRGSSLSDLAEVDISSSAGGADAGGDGAAVAVPAIEATSYSIQVVDPVADEAPFSFSLVQPDAGPPANDDFASATSLDTALAFAATGSGTDSSAAQGTTAGATVETGEAGPNASAPAHSVWYYVDIPLPGAGGPVTVSLAASPLPNEPSGLSLVAFTGDNLAGLQQVATSTGGLLAIPPSTQGRVFIAVDGPETYFTLALAETGVAPPDTTPPTIACSPPSGWTKSTTVACTATDSGSPLADPADASFELDADVPPGVATADAETNSQQVCDKAGNCATAGPYKLEVDRSAPVVDCLPAPTGWSAANVTVGCRATDTGSGLSGSADASFSLSTDVAPGTADQHASFVAHAAVCDNVGNCTDVPQPAPARVDRTRPVVTCGKPVTAWLDTQGTISCQATDRASGLADAADASFKVATDVAPTMADSSAYTVRLSICSVAGDCTEVAPIGPFKVDLSLPVVKCALPRGYTKGSSVSVPCTVSDEGSGLAPSSPSSFSLSASIKKGTVGGARSTSTTICSVAGNCVTVGPFDAIGLADSPPTVTCSPVPATWQRGPVNARCVASDAGPGLADPADAHFSLVANVPAGTADASVTFPTRTVCDTVGNCTSELGLPTVKIDNAAPVVTCSPVPSGPQVEEIVVACKANDSGSGLLDPQDASFTLRTSVVAGTRDAHALTSSARVCDVAGNCTTVGPFAGDVDLRGKPSAAPPLIETRGTIRVLDAALEPAHEASVGVAVPFGLPKAIGGVGGVQVACSPEPAALFSLGLTLVTCGAADQADQSSEASFYVSVALVPALAPTGPATAGELWRAVGTDFGPGSAVSVELGGTLLAEGHAGADGRFDQAVLIPLATPIGREDLVLRGTDNVGAPLLVVAPLVVDASTTRTVSKTLPHGAPSAPPAHVTLPGAGPPVAPPHIIPVADRPNGTAGPGLGPNAAGTTVPTTVTTSPTPAPGHHPGGNTSTTTITTVSGRHPGGNTSTTTTVTGHRPAPRRNSGTTTTTGPSSTTTTAGPSSTTTTAGPSSTTTTAGPSSTTSSPTAPPTTVSAARPVAASPASSPWWIWLVVGVAAVLGLGSIGGIVWWHRRA